ncbi:MAG: LysM peptidoglycan-binding domain-containing protein [Bacteroidota bacterium]|nr:LysM peptidoglycan-binding domain-containing protein [Bacteroidota bacterium]
MIKNALILCTFLIFNNLYSQNSGQPIGPDSLFLVIQESDSLFLSHKIMKKETLYGICRKYNIPLKEFMEINPGKDLQFQIGDIVYIPISNTTIEDHLKPNLVPIYYHVKVGDNLFRIAKKALHRSVKDIMKLNQLSTNAISEGDIILAGYYKLNMDQIENDILLVKEEVKHIKSTELVHEPIEEEVKHWNQFARGVAFKQKGIGVGRFYALHREAAINSNIEITNPITNSRVYAKVIGRIPKTFPKDVQVVVSEEIARELLSLDQRFFVYVKYNVR